MDSYTQTEASTPVLVMIDDDDPLLEAYLTIDFPAGFSFRIGKRRSLSELYNSISLTHDWYGFIADDVIPRTKLWDRLLIDAAGKDGMSVPEYETEVAPHFVLGGDLVRDVGFLCLQGLDRIYIDTVWNDIAKSRGVFRETDVILEHCHFSTGAPFDLTYKKHNKPQDKRIYEEWKNDHTP